jgi:NAD(P)-dependent dehydrogenase (short-subunit alcohol dehydrogenase family)
MAISPQGKTIVITGCSSGFGRLTALHLARRGWHVFATVRRASDQANLLAEAEQQSCQQYITPVICDITQAEQVAELARTVSAATPGLDALLNNAGTAFAAPLEILSLDDFRSQLEINVVAHLGVTQALLPQIKAARGIIINTSSVNGRIAMPIVGAYSASKFALEAISDALRVELAPFGVQVVVIEPSSSPTNIWQTSTRRASAKLEEHRAGPYARLLVVFEKIAARASTTGFPPQLFADTVDTILTTRCPRSRYVIPTGARRQVLLHKLLPDRLWDRQVRRILKW